jgi:hypothetical protein
MFPHLTAEQVTRVCDRLTEIVVAAVDEDVA